VPPVLPLTNPVVVLLDGFYLAYPSIKRNRHRPRAKTVSCILLWALDSRTSKPIYWKFYFQVENPRIWQDFIGGLTEGGIVPDYAVHDGHSGITIAVNNYWNKTKHQRCFVHLMGNMHKDLGINPKTTVARELKQVVAGMFSIADEITWQTWNKQWQLYCQKHSRTLEALRTNQLCFDDNGNRIPKAVLEAFTVINNAYKRDELIAFLDNPKIIPRTTNSIESLNGNLRELLQRHRGLNLEKRINLVSWYLALKQKQTSEQLRDVLHTLSDT
jgi:transposase-like protein